MLVAGLSSSFEDYAPKYTRTSTLVTIVFSHPVDSKREEFRKYLEKAGVLDVITKALVELLEAKDRPSDAMEFLRQQLAAANPHANEISALQDELTKTNEQLKLLTIENTNLKNKLQQLQQYEGNAAV
ncbi:c-Myc-binding protein-like isoform X2 [Centruroides sculpturatus]|uniref:c-Myc-binding protein-like isoform X2 n=1 Tax=Centruroides sculpturatus TaxID=218467 RepID=UPI000C6D4F7F|nr:c-Myc-binding protein-like isoform X2 [Centruroides sculpturatus]